MIRRYTFFLGLTCLVFVSCSGQKNVRRASQKKDLENPVAKNIIFFIVDGMGFNHVRAAKIYNGLEPLSFENSLCQTQVTTCAFEGADTSGQCIKNSHHVTDSAAAATAIATGKKVSNGVISQKIPGESSDVKTILEIAKANQKSTGVIATKLFSDATPAAFTSHTKGRKDTEEILSDMFLDAKPNVVFGSDTLLHRKIAKDSPVPYRFAHGKKELLALSREIENDRSCQGQNCFYVYGGFGQYDLIPGAYNKTMGLPLEITPQEKYESMDIPHLSEMTGAALKILSKNEQGFFLMVESSMPDIISHYNAQIDDNEESPTAISVLIREILEVDRTMKVIDEFVKKNPDTLVILTADHETGGLEIAEKNTLCLGRKSCLPKVQWTSEKYDPSDKESAAKHTGANVPLYAKGVGAERFCKAQINNTEIKGLALAQ